MKVDKKGLTVKRTHQPPLLHYLSNPTERISVGYPDTTAIDLYGAVTPMRGTHLHFFAAVVHKDRPISLKILYRGLTLFVVDTAGCSFQIRH